MNKPLVVILSTVTLDAIGTGLIFPILPGLLRDVTHSWDIATLYGLIIATFAAMQFLFLPVMGVLSDRFGRRPVLLLSLAGASIDYLLLAFAPQLWMLVVGRAIAGLTSANMAVATAYVTDITPEAQRAQRFGYFHAMFGLGFIIGPALGGVLGDYWIRAPFVAAALLNGANFALALFVLPESRPGSKGAKFDFGSLNPFKPMGWALSFKALLPLMGIFLIMNFVGQTYGTVWVLFSQDAFHWDGLTIGLSLSAYGLFHAGAQAFVAGPVTGRVGGRAALILGLACESVALVVMGFTTQGWVLFALGPLFGLSGVGMPALQSMATAQVGEDKQGQLQGVLASILSLTAIFGPLFFSTVYFLSRESWPGLTWIVGLLIYLLAVPLILGLKLGRTAATPI